LCDVGRVAVKHCFKLLSFFLHLYLLFYYILLTVLNLYLV